MKLMGLTAKPAAFVLGLSPTGLHVVRTLGRAGVKVTGVARSLQAGCASRHLDRVLIEPDTDRRLAEMCRLAVEVTSDVKPVLLPTSDQDVDFIIVHAEVLANYFSFQDSYSDGVAENIMSKDRFHDLCLEHNVRCPRIWRMMKDQLGDLSQEVTYPVMIKPARIDAVKDGMNGKKGWTAADASDLLACIDDIPDGAGLLLVQEIVPGPESAISLACVHADRRGGMRQMFTARKLRQFPPGFGSASLVQSSSEIESATVTSEFLRAMGYRGIAAAEFKRHLHTNELHIIEINVRPSLWFSLSDAAARPVVLSAYLELAGLPCALEEHDQIDGIRWRYAVKDAWSAMFYRTARSFLLPKPDTRVTGPAVRTIGAVFEFGDPVPAVIDLLNFAGKAVRRMLKRCRLLMSPMRS